MDKQHLPEEERNGELVNFPTDLTRLPPQRLPANIGRMDDNHPLKRPLAIFIILFLTILAGFFVYVTIFGQVSSGKVVNESTFSGQYQQAGKITYEGEILNGNFLDPEMQHFQSGDGRRFTYVDSHDRESNPVTGYWRLIEH